MMDGIWDDGEWISWGEINQHIYEQEKRDELKQRGITDEKYLREEMARDGDETTLVEELLHASVQYHKVHKRYLAPYSFFKKHVDALCLDPEELEDVMSDEHSESEYSSPDYFFARDVERYKKGELIHTRSTPPISHGWLLSFAERYYQEYSQHLPIYGEIGERYAADRFGFTQNPALAQGSDGRMKKPESDHTKASVLIEVKTITPIKKEPYITVKRAGNWGVLAIVKIDENMRIEGKLIKRSLLLKGQDDYIRVHWDDYTSDHLELSPEYQII
ncbi:hypothetical protein ACFPK9_10700 [Rubritalea spongiae]|uniref:DUF3883 domain-containing protein n=1 Tax=Rubritalea spongiae TaxID=430797 RepID=A0ABW5DYF4_9BACT